LSVDERRLANVQPPSQPIASLLLLVVN